MEYFRLGNAGNPCGKLRLRCHGGGRFVSRHGLRAAYWPEITRIITFDGYSILVQYPVADNFELSGETLVNHAPMPTMLVSAALAVLFVVIPSLVVTRNESGSEAEAKALRRVSIAQAVALGVMLAAFAIFFLVTWFD